MSRREAIGADATTLLATIHALADGTDATDRRIVVLLDLLQPAIQNLDDAGAAYYAGNRQQARVMVQRASDVVADVGEKLRR